jgi:hypothetical protein
VEVPAARRYSLRTLAPARSLTDRPGCCIPPCNNLSNGSDCLDSRAHVPALTSVPPLCSKMRSRRRTLLVRMCHRNDGALYAETLDRRHGNASALLFSAAWSIVAEFCANFWRKKACPLRAKSSRDGAEGFARDFRTFLGMPTLEQPLRTSGGARGGTRHRSCRKARRRAIVGNEPPVLHALGVN